MIRMPLPASCANRHNLHNWLTLFGALILLIPTSSFTLAAVFSRSPQPKANMGQLTFLLPTQRKAEMQASSMRWESWRFGGFLSNLHRWLMMYNLWACPARHCRRGLSG